jgi:hypothetical protein
LDITGWQGEQTEQIEQEQTEQIDQTEQTEQEHIEAEVDKQRDQGQGSAESVGRVHPSPPCEPLSEEQIEAMIEGVLQEAGVVEGKWAALMREQAVIVTTVGGINTR